MATLLPPPVKAGDAVSIVAPASPVNVETLEVGIALLRSWGLEPIVDPRVYSKHAYVAGLDEDRAQALIDAFDDKNTTAVICATGGFGCTRLAPFLPVEKLGPHNVLPKRFFGFSDITAIHCALRIAVPGYVSFHAPMLATSSLNEGTDESKEALRNALFAGSLKDACPPLEGRCLQMGRASYSEGVVRGRLIGGNLSLFSSVVGTSWQEEFKGCVLLLEDINEPLYRLDRMFTQLLAARGGSEALGQLAALVLGDFGTVFARDDIKVYNKYSIQEISQSATDHEMQPDDDKALVWAEKGVSDLKAWFWLEQMGIPRDLPILIDVPIGHLKDNRVAPLGAFVEVNLNSGELKVAEEGTLL